MKITDILEMAARSMLRNKTRTTLTIVAIFVASFTIMLTTAISAGAGEYMAKQTDGYGARNALIVTVATDTTGEGPQPYDPAQTGGSADPSLALTPADIAALEETPGVASVSPVRTAMPDYIEGADGAYALGAQAIVHGQKLDLVAGTSPESDENPQIAITEEYLGPLGFDTAERAVGQTVTIGVSTPARVERTVEAIISGVMNESLLNGGLLLTNATLQNLIVAIAEESLPPEATQNVPLAVAYLTSDAASDIEAAQDALAARGYTGKTVEDSIGLVTQVFQAITIVLTAFGVIALLAATLGVVNTLYMSVQDRTKEIGLMKANGLSSGRVFALFSSEAVLLGLCGSLLGAVAAAGAGALANAVAAETFLADFPGFTLMLFPAGGVTAIVLGVSAITFLAGTLPARRAAQLNPINALRYE